VRYPDGSFIRRGRLPDDKPPKGHIRIAPDIALEVVSPNDAAEAIQIKIDEYLRAGVRLVWVVYPSTRQIFVHRPDSSVSRLTAADELTGEDVLPGLSCRVADFFASI
jgi:Uma2 family endonuclease